jgi:hypothetical protein
LTALRTEGSGPQAASHAGIEKGLSSYGARKTVQTLGAENGLTDRELMSISGHETTKETTRYTKKRDRDRLADQAYAKHANLRIGAPGLGLREGAPMNVATATISTPRQTGGAPGRDRTSTPCGTRF